jgi:hypothetical protein
MKTKISSFSTILIFGIIIYSSFSLAQTGCFLYPDSPMYCNDMEALQAGEECSFYDSCNLEQFFQVGESCIDTLRFPECELVLCKSSCDYDFRGSCSSGEILASEEAQWCSPGCCMFSDANGDYCQATKNKWLCENLANNRNVPNFAYDTSISETQCNSLCSTGIAPPTESVSERNFPTNLEAATETAPVTATKTTSVAKASSPTPTKSSGFGWWLLAIFLLIVIVYFSVHTYLKWEQLFGKMFSSEKNNKPTENVIPENFVDKNYPLFIPKPTNKSKQITPEQKKRLRSNYLMEAGLTPLKVKESPFTRLERYVKYHSAKKSTQKEEKYVDKLKSKVVEKSQK